MLIFETSYTNKPFHVRHGNVIYVKKSFIFDRKKIYKHFFNLKLTIEVA